MSGNEEIINRESEEFNAEFEVQEAERKRKLLEHFLEGLSKKLSEKKIPGNIWKLKRYKKSDWSLTSRPTGLIKKLKKKLSPKVFSFVFELESGEACEVNVSKKAPREKWKALRLLDDDGSVYYLTGKNSEIFAQIQAAFIRARAYFDVYENIYYQTDDISRGIQTQYDDFILEVPGVSVRNGEIFHNGDSHVDSAVIKTQENQSLQPFYNETSLATEFEQVAASFSRRILHSFVNGVSLFRTKATTVFYKLGESSLKKLGMLKFENDSARLDVMLQSVEEMLRVHAKGIVHKDIKPDNFTIDKDNNVSLIDFGLSQKLKRDGTSHGGIKGSYGYMPPEIAKTTRKYYHIEDERCSYSVSTDCWSMGVLLLEQLYLLYLTTQSEAELNISGEEWPISYNIYNLIQQSKDASTLESQIHDYIQSKVLLPCEEQFKNHAHREVISSLLALSKKMLTVSPENRPTSQEIEESIAKARLQIPKLNIKKARLTSPKRPNLPNDMQYLVLESAVLCAIEKYKIHQIDRQKTFQRHGKKGLKRANKLMQRIYGLKEDERNIENLRKILQKTFAPKGKILGLKRKPGNYNHSLVRFALESFQASLISDNGPEMLKALNAIGVGENQRKALNLTTMEEYIKEESPKAVTQTSAVSNPIPEGEKVVSHASSDFSFKNNRFSYFEREAKDCGTAFLKAMKSMNTRPTPGA